MKKGTIRFTIFFCSFYFIYVLYNAWNGVNVINNTYRILIEYCLYLSARDNPKYNCKYARFLALNIPITESITYIDNTYNLFNGVVTLSIISATWIISVVVTIILAFKHFYKVRNIGKWKILSSQKKESLK